MTKKENFTAIRDFLADAGKTEWVEVMNHELDLLSAKSGALKKPTEAQEQNKVLMNAIVEILTEQDTAMTQKEIMALNDPRLTGIKSAQHLNSLIIKLCLHDAKGNLNPKADGRIDRSTTKGGESYFYIVKDEDAE
jgi:hypothetical protein